MPISAENQKLYGAPKVWRAIRAAVKARAGDKCEGCGVKNHTRRDSMFPGDACMNITVPVVCTTAHLDHDPTHNDGFERTGNVLPLEDSNLRLYCQRCHNRHDAKHRAASRARTLDRKRGQEHLFGEGR